MRVTVTLAGFWSGDIPYRGLTLVALTLLGCDAVLPPASSSPSIALTLCAVAAVAGVLLAARQPTRRHRARAADGWAGAQRPPGQPVPDFTLRDQDGKTVTAASLRGQPVVFAFIYSTCRDTCPAQVQTIRGALDDLPGNDIRA